MMNETRIIKKYPNRRLYDMAESCYITLENIKQLVIKCTEFCVIDSKTKDDITNSILLQVINELEHTSTPIFTTEILKNIIRFYGNTIQDMVSQYIEKGMALFIRQQTDLQGHVKDLNKLVNYYMSSWQAGNEQLLSESVKKTKKS